MKTLKIGLLVVLLISAKAFAYDDCNLPYGDPPCECCEEKWGGGAPPNLAYVVFQGIERTDCDPGWVMLPPPNNRLFLLRLTEDFTGNTCEWSYNLDVIGGEGGIESDTWVISFDLTAYYSYNVYLANKVDNPPADMFYFWRRGHTDCNDTYLNEAQNWNCDGTFFYFWAGGTARIFWDEVQAQIALSDFNSDGIVNFKDFSILNSMSDPNHSIREFAANWLSETE